MAAPGGQPQPQMAQTAPQIPQSNNIIDDFQAAFQNCFAAVMNQEHFNTNDSDEIKAGVEQSIQKFIDIGRQIECFFLQKRLLLSLQKPEQTVTEEIMDLKHELARKDNLIQKHQEKLAHWQNMLRTLQGGLGAQPPATSQTSTTTQPTPGPNPTVHLQHSPGQAPGGPRTPPVSSQPAGHPVMAGTGASSQGPLAYLEQTTSNIGLPERR